MSGKLLLVSNVRLGCSTSRGANLESRAEMLEDEGWETVVGHVPPPYVRTVVPSLLCCLWLAWREDVDLVTSVSNPFHLQLIGFLVAAVTRRPWIAEIRDPVVENPDRDPEALTTKLATVVEWLVAHAADRIVWGDGIQMEEDYFETTYSIPPEKVQKLPFKGFDPEVFETAEPVTDERFTITYAGSFYDGWIEPYSFFAGLEQYLDDTGDGPSLRVQCYGDWRAAYDEVVERRGLLDVVSHHEFVPKDEFIPILKGSDALLYIGGSDPANRLNVPSKIYDYIGARAPILAVVDPSFRVANLVREERLGVVAPYDDPDAIAEAIERVRESDRFDPDEELYERFDRQRKIEALVDAYETETAA